LRYGLRRNGASAGAVERNGECRGAAAARRGVVVAAAVEKPIAASAAIVAKNLVFFVMPFLLNVPKKC